MMTNIGSIQKDIFGGNNINNTVCLPNKLGGTLRGDNKEDTVLGVSSKCHQTEKCLHDSV